MRHDSLLDRVQRALLTSPLNGQPCIEQEGASEHSTPAAVLILIVLRDPPSVLLTQRTSHLRDHPGQISFPGGRIEATDQSTLLAALRETEEEIGLSPASVTPLGYLPCYVTGTGFEVTPVVAVVNPPLELTADPFEVAEIFEVPLWYLLEDCNYQKMAIYVQGRRRAFYSIPYENRFIWGATAGMIRSLYDRMRPRI